MNNHISDSKKSADVNDANNVANIGQTYLQKFKYSLIVLAFPALLIGVLGPLEIYSGNTSELFFGTGDFIWLFLGISVVIVFSFAALLGLMSDKIRGIIHSIIFAFSLMAYIQNMFLNKQLMKTDGSKMDWDLYRSYTIINTIVWIAVIVAIVNALLIVRDAMHKIIIYVSAFVSMVQFLTIIMLLFTLPYSVKSDSMSVLDSSGEFALAKDNNIIVLILDRYGNVTFDNRWEEDEKFLDIYKDFTYYQNANSKYNYTFPSIPYIMTLKDPDCTITADEYKKIAWQEGMSSKFHDIVKNYDYTYNFYTGSGRACFLNASYLTGSVDNIKTVDGVTYKINYGRMLKLFTKTSFYKFAPYFAKPRLEVQSFVFDGIVEFQGIDSCIEDNGAYYEVLCDRGLSINDNMTNAIVVTHLSGIHDPLSIDANGNRVSAEMTDKTQVQLGLNVILAKYFDELKRLNLYDSSTIIIMADHGEYKDSLDPQPIFLVKLPGQQQEKVVFNNAPISTEDLLPTILNIIGADYSEFGTSVFEIYEDEERERTCYYPNTGFEVYTYTGDKNQLRSKIRDGVFTKIDATEDWD